MAPPATAKKKKKSTTGGAAAPKAEVRHDDHADHGHGDHHGPPLSAYFAVFFTLLVLTGVTVGVAFVDLGVLNTPVALAIACFKATIVILYFMHVKYSTRLIKLYAASGFVWTVLMFVLTMADVVARSGHARRDPLQYDRMLPKAAATTTPAAAAHH